MSDFQKTIQSRLDQFVAEKKECGIQVAAYLKGEMVVDAFAGIMDRVTQRPVDGDTLFPVFSVTKGIVATIIHRLAERGLLDYDTPLAAYWPEFAAHGKGGITLRHGLNHTAGLAAMPMPLTLDELYDWDLMCARIADLTPESPPGAEMAYHAITYGWIVGEVACRVSGRSFPQLVQEEICVPLGMTNLFMGLPENLEPRVAVLEDAVYEPGPASDATPQSIPSLVKPLSTWMNSSAARRACIPASNGIMTARTIARHYAALLPGGVDGVELLTPARVLLAIEPQCPSGTPGAKPPQGRGLGYGLTEPNSIMGERPTVFGHAGYGGAVGFADLASGLAFAVTRNRLGSDEGPRSLIRYIFSVLS